MGPLMTFLTWLEATPLAGVMRQSPWSYPLVQTAHILGFILVKGAAAMFDLRLLGSTPRLPVVDVARHLLPFRGRSRRALWFNPVFRAKMALIDVAGFNAAGFHAWPFRSVAT